MDDHDAPLPIRASVTHSVSARLGLVAVTLLVALMLAPVWLPLVTPARHTLRYTALTAGPNHDAFAVLNKDGIHPGETIQMQVSACNESDRPLGVSVSRQMILSDSEDQTSPYLFDDIHGTWQPGCSPALISQAHKVPEGAKPGRYYLKGVTSPDDGSAPLPWRSESFQVVAGG